MTPFRSKAVVGLLVMAMTLAAGDRAAADERSDVDGLNQRMMQLYEQGHYADATPLAAQIVAILEKSLGPANPALASALNNLAELYVKQRRYAEAEPLYRRSLAIRETALGPTHPDTIKSRARLVDLYRSMGRTDEAAVTSGDASSVRPPPRPQPGQYGQGPVPQPSPRPMPATPPTSAPRDMTKQLEQAHDLNEQVLALNKQGRDAEGIPLAQQALTIYEKVFGPDDPRVATVVSNLAQLYVNQQQTEQAETLYKRSLAILEKARGANSPDVAQALSTLAAFYDRLHRFADAEPLYRRCLAIREALLGANDPDVVKIRAALADIAGRRAWDSGAMPASSAGPQLADLYTGAAPVAGRSINAPEAKDVLRSQQLDRQVSALTSQKRYGDALPVALELQALLEKLYGANNIAVALNLDSLVLIYNGLGRPADAAPLALRAQAIRDKATADQRADAATHRQERSPPPSDDRRDPLTPTAR